MNTARPLRPVVFVFALAFGGLRADAQRADLERARQMLSSGHAAEAAAIYEELSRADPGNATLLLNLSIAEYKAGSFSEAAASAASALKTDPNLVPARLFLGASCLQTGEYDRAIDALRFVVATEPADRNARLMLGQAFLNANRPAEAIEHLQRASELGPDSPGAWYALGQAYESVERKGDADAAWRRLSELPTSMESHMHAAEISEAEHRWDEAAAEWRAALKLSPQNAEVSVKMAWSLFRRRDYEQAMRVLDSLGAAGDRVDVAFLYGASFLNMQQPDKAIPFLRRALARDRASLPARAALGQALLQTGKPAEAIPLLDSAVGIDQDGSVHFQLFRAYQLTGDQTKAERALADYRRLRGSPAGAR